MKILISGAGIAGTTLAYWLLQRGFEPTLVEAAPTLRRGGYVIDFWGSGFEVAERMGLAPELRKRGYDVHDVRIVDARGRVIGGFPVEVFRDAAHGRYVSVPRGELASMLWDALDGRVETLLGDTIVGLDDGRDGVEVRFAHAAPRRFDLVVGADGLHSAVRRVAFGDQDHVERYLGCCVAAFEASGYRPRDEDVYVMHVEVGQQVDRFSLRDDRTMFLFVWRAAEGEDEAADLAGRKAVVRARFAATGWECPAILDAMDAADELYFDRMSQIYLPRWSKGRVALVGDAAACPSLLAGEGSALAMAGAYVLAGELASHADHRTALQRYEERLHPTYEAKQRAAIGFLDSFAPRSRLSCFLRTRGTRVFSIPWLAGRLVRSWLDPVALPNYPPPDRARRREAPSTDGASV
ncbi:MAG TPA: FAD-binding domain [Byssovorax sp.]